MVFNRPLMGVGVFLSALKGARYKYFVKLSLYGAFLKDLN